MFVQILIMVKIGSTYTDQIYSVKRAPLNTLLVASLSQVHTIILKVHMRLVLPFFDIPNILRSQWPPATSPQNLHIPPSYPYQYQYEVISSSIQETEAKICIFITFLGFQIFYVILSGLYLKTKKKNSYDNKVYKPQRNLQRCPIGIYCVYGESVCLFTLLV